MSEEGELYCVVCRRSFSQLKRIGFYRYLPCCFSGSDHQFTHEIFPELTLANIEGPVEIQ